MTFLGLDQPPQYINMYVTGPFPYFWEVGPGDEATIKVLAQSSQQPGKGNRTIKLAAKTEPFLVAPAPVSQLLNLIQQAGRPF